MRKKRKPFDVRAAVDLMDACFQEVRTGTLDFNACKTQVLAVLRAEAEAGGREFWTDFHGNPRTEAELAAKKDDYDRLRDKTVRNALLDVLRESMKPMLELVDRLICRKSMLEVNETRNTLKIVGLQGRCKCGPCRLRREVKKLKWLDPGYVCQQDRKLRRAKKRRE